MAWAWQASDTWKALHAAQLADPDATGNYAQYYGGGEAPKDAPTVTRRLFVDNRDRRDPANASPFDFTLSLTECGVPRYENVGSVELKGIAFPKVNDEMYVVMDVDRLNEQLDSTSSAAHRAFALLYFDNDAMTPGSVKPIKAYDFYQKSSTFNPPLPVVDVLHVRFLKHDGTVVTSDDTAGNTDVSFLLEATMPPSRY